MAETRDLGRFFFHTIRLRPDAPRYHRAFTQEVEEPFRRSHSVVLRIFRGCGVVLGRWRETFLEEDAALVAALGRELDSDPEDIEQWLSSYDR